MLKIVLIALAVLIVVFVIVVMNRPADFRVSRQIFISAPPVIIFPHVNDLHKWQEWSPWAKLDPNARTTFEGPSAGVGAIFRWAGNMQVGEGGMTIIESHPSDLVKFRLDFLKPFKGTNIAEFTIRPDGDLTTVTWSMTGTNNFITKAVGLFMDCEKMCGGQFEKGLADLQTIAEAETQKQTAAK